MEAVEEWRSVVGYEGWYDVSSHGRVRRVARAFGAVPGRIRKPYPKPRTQNSNGAASPDLTIQLSLGGKTKYKCLRIARVVAEAFIGSPPSSRHQVNHKDLDTTNNFPANLEWVTPAENTAHAERHGVMRKGERHPAAKLTDVQVAEIRRRVLAGELQTELAKEFGISGPHVCALHKGRFRKSPPKREREPGEENGQA